MLLITDSIMLIVVAARMGGRTGVPMFVLFVASSPSQLVGSRILLPTLDSLSQHTSSQITHLKVTSMCHVCTLISQIVPHANDSLFHVHVEYRQSICSSCIELATYFFCCPTAILDIHDSEYTPNVSLLGYVWLQLSRIAVSTERIGQQRN